MQGLSERQEKILFLTLENKFVTVETLLSLWGDLPEVGLRKDSNVYNAAHASLSRSLTRLWQRGLIIIWKTLTHSSTGVTLTEIGAQVARSVMQGKKT